MPGLLAERAVMRILAVTMGIGTQDILAFDTAVTRALMVVSSAAVKELWLMLYLARALVMRSAMGVLQRAACGLADAKPQAARVT